jgi:tetratricopeptide (TPR) repeat protein
MKRHIFKALLCVAILAGFFASPAHGAASYKQWRSSLKAAQEARIKRDFETARAILEKSAPDAAELGPESSAENSWNLGRIFFETEQYNEALAVIDPALEKIGAKPVAQNSQLWRGLLLSAKAVLLFAQKNYDPALAIAEQARDTLENVAGKFHPELSILHGLTAKLYEMKKDYPKAEAAYKAALKLAESRQVTVVEEWSGPESEMVRYRSQNSAEAEDIYSKGVKAAESRYGKKGQAVIIPLAARAELFHKINRRAEFEKDTKRVYELATKGPGLDMWTVHPLWLKLQWDLKENQAGAAAQTAEKIANVYAIQSYDLKSMATHAMNVAVEGTKTNWVRAAQIQESIRNATLPKFGAEPAKTGQLLVAFALTAEEAQQGDLARLNYEAVLRTQEKAADKGLYIAAAGKLAEYAISQNKPAEALPFYQKISAGLREKYGDDSRVANAMDREADLLKLLGRAKEAADVATKASAVRTKAMLKR